MKIHLPSRWDLAIVDAILGENKAELPGSLHVQLSLMGDPFAEDPNVTLQKVKAIWSHIRTQMPILWKEAQNHVYDEHQRIVRSKLPSDLKSMAKAAKDRFSILVYDMLHNLVESSGLPPLSDMDNTVWLRLAEIVQDDMHDFISNTGYRE